MATQFFCSSLTHVHVGWRRWPGSSAAKVLRERIEFPLIDFCCQDNRSLEGCIASQPVRVATATAMEPVSALKVGNHEMIRAIREEREFSDRFVAHMLRRNARIEEDLVDQLFNSSEKRLARALLPVARYGNNTHQKVVAQVSQETRAEIISTTRSRVSFFMNKFRKLGFIKDNGGLEVNDSLLRVILHE